MKLNILFIIDQLAESTAGTEQHLSFLIKKLPQSACNIHLMLLRDTGYFDYNHYPTSPLFLNFKSFRNPLDIITALHKLIKFIKENDIHIVQSYFNDSEIISILACEVVKDCALVINRRDTGYLNSGPRLLVKRITGKFAHNVLVNCEAIKKYVRACERIPSERITVIPNPINLDRISEEAEAPASIGGVNFTPERNIVGIVAGTREVKDHETFLLAAANVLKQCPGAQFLIIGNSTPERKYKLEGMAKYLGISGNVFFLGPIDNPIPIMKLFDVAVLCSTSEGFSNTLIEYSALGLPIVATDVGGNPEIVEHQKTGILVPPSAPELVAKSVIELLNNGEYRRTLGANAREYVTDHFSQEITIEKYLTYYNKILEKIPQRN